MSEEPLDKLKELRALEEAIDIIEAQDFPDLVKADIHLLIRRFLFVVMGTVHAGFIEEFQDFHKYLTERALTLKAKCKEELLKERRSKLRVVKDEDPTTH